MKKNTINKLIALIAFVMSIVVTAQAEYIPGPHQMQKEEFGTSQQVNKSIVNTKLKSIIGLNQSKASTLSKKVFGFLPYWEQVNGAHDNIRYDLLTHLACFDFLVKMDASVSTPAGWPWTTEINAAHAEGVEVVMTLVNFGGTDGADAVAWEMITNTTKQATLFANVKNLIQTYNLDGVNVDFEGMSTAHRGVELNTFMANLTSYIHTELPGKEVSFCGPAVNWGGWVMDGLVNSVDYLIIMAYDYTSASGANSGPIAPLLNPVSWKRFVKRTVETGTYAVPNANTPEKLILAVPYYGQHWKTVTNASESLTISHVASTRYRNTVTEANTHGGFIWNSDFEYPWYTWNDGTNWNQVWTDNELSISKKFDLAIDNNLGGVGMWALNYDGGRTELWELINTKFGVTASTDDVIFNHVQIHPNPVKSDINISNTENIKFKSIELFSVLGESIMKISPETKLINVEHLANGLYFLNISDLTGKRATFKILKSN